MSLSDIFRTEHREFVIPGPPDRVTAWFSYNAPGATQRWNELTLQLSKSRAGGYRLAQRGVSPQVGPWLEVTAEPDTRGSLVRCRIGPLGSDWAWLALNAVGSLIAFGLLVGGVWVIANSQDSAGLVFGPGGLFVGFWVLGTIVGVARGSRQGERNRTWAGDLLETTIRQLQSTAPRPAPLAAPVTPVTPVTPSPPSPPIPHALPIPFALVAPKPNESPHVGSGFTTIRRRFRVDLPLMQAEAQLIRVPPHWVIQQKGRFVLTAPVARPGFASPRSAAGRFGLASGEITLTAAGGATEVDAVISPWRALGRVALGLPISLGLFWFWVNSFTPGAIWVVLFALVWTTLPLLVMTPLSARQLDRAFSDTMAAMGAIDLAAGIAATPVAPVNVQRPGPYTSGPQPWGGQP